MATGRSSFAKRQRDMAKKARAEAKRQKRLGRGELFDLEHGQDDDILQAPLSASNLSNDEIMARVEELHRRYDDGQVDLDTFDEQRATLMAQIAVD